MKTTAAAEGEGRRRRQCCSAAFPPKSQFMTQRSSDFNSVARRAREGGGRGRGQGPPLLGLQTSFLGGGGRKGGQAVSGRRLAAALGGWVSSRQCVRGVREGAAFLHYGGGGGAEWFISPLMPSFLPSSSSATLGLLYKGHYVSDTCPVP